MNNLPFAERRIDAEVSDSRLVYAEGAKGLLKDGGSKRAQVVREMSHGLGATVEAFYFALGEDDVFVIVDAPNLASVTALALATTRRGRCG